MIFIGLGANLPSKRFGKPENTLQGIINHLDDSEIKVLSNARVYKSAPVPVSNDPWYFNTVIGIQTNLSPSQLMLRLLETEIKFGRKRSGVNAPRTIDLDLLDYNGLVINMSVENSGIGLNLPHPRMDKRAFVLLPLNDLDPNWCHPILKISIRKLIKNLDPKQNIVVLD
tara:strand:- start:1826 stop:2335 length:510 start_codon:yes stop_codon:yes gene_type:complete